MPPSTLDSQVGTDVFPIRELLVPEAFQHPVGEIALRETHISWVVLTGSFAYKIKKAVKFDFIDALTLERRRTMCEEELRLNRRLAPELYMDVVPITRKAGRLVVGGEGAAVEYAVRMQQFPASDELPALLARQDVTLAQMEALGESLAQFHLTLPSRREPTLRRRRSKCMSRCSATWLSCSNTSRASLRPVCIT